MTCAVAPTSRHRSKPWLGLLSQLCDEDLGALKLIGFDAQPDVRKARVGVAVLALGEAELFGPVSRLRQVLGGARQVAAHHRE